MNVIEEISRRAEELLLCKQDKKRQAYVMELCRRDIIFFFNNFVYTEKNATLFGANDPHAIPFVLFPFQEELVKEIWSSIVTGTLSTEDREDFTNVFLEKSRQMGVTWVVM